MSIACREGHLEALDAPGQSVGVTSTYASLTPPSKKHRLPSFSEEESADLNDPPSILQIHLIKKYLPSLSVPTCPSTPGCEVAMDNIVEDCRSELLKEQSQRETVRFPAFRVWG